MVERHHPAVRDWHGNVVEGNVSFENMDNMTRASTCTTRTTGPAPGRHSDGNGFIVDENSNGAKFSTTSRSETAGRACA